MKMKAIGNSYDDRSTTITSTISGSPRRPGASAPRARAEAGPADAQPAAPAAGAILGCRLLERGPRGVRRPRRVHRLDYCERIFCRATSWRRRCSRRHLRPRHAAPGRLRVRPLGAVTQVLEHLHKLDAHLRISVLGAPAENLRERLGQHRLDLVVSHGTSRPSWASSSGVWPGPSRFILWVPRRWRSASRDSPRTFPASR